MKEAFYFGCGRGSGHYLHDERGTTLHSHVEQPTIPWKIGLMDTGLLVNGKIPDEYTGKVYWTCGKTPDRFWFAFYWWDRSGDSRPNSNSGFYVSGFDYPEIKEAFEFACSKFPNVVARQKFPLVLQNLERLQ